MVLSFKQVALGHLRNPYASGVMGFQQEHSLRGTTMLDVLESLLSGVRVSRRGYLRLKLVDYEERYFKLEAFFQSLLPLQLAKMHVVYL